ncbi:MAG: hypothetical protein WD231_01055 [Candidatus Woykebacteria bacterium]
MKIAVLIFVILSSPVILYFPFLLHGLGGGGPVPLEFKIIYLVTFTSLITSIISFFFVNKNKFFRFLLMSSFVAILVELMLIIFTVVLGNIFW